MAKRLGLLCLGFKGVKEEIRSEEASTLQIGSVAFPPGQCTSPQLHPCHRLFDQDGLKTGPQPPYSRDLAPCDFWLFPKLRGCRFRNKLVVVESLLGVDAIQFLEPFKMVLCMYGAASSTPRRLNPFNKSCCFLYENQPNAAKKGKGGHEIIMLPFLAKTPPVEAPRID